MCETNKNPYGVDAELGDLVTKIIGGGTPSRMVPKYWNGNIPWASVKDFNDEDVLLKSTQEQISVQGLASSAANLIPTDIPVMCARMAVGRCGLTTEPTAINQDLKALFPATDVDTRYLLWLLKFAAPSLSKQGTGSTVSGISVSQILSLQLYKICDKRVQRAIATILDTMDDAIHRTEAVIAKLRQVKAGMLHDLLTRGLDEHGELRDPLRHPEQFKDSPLGRIPKEWVSQQIQDVLVRKPSNGFSPKETSTFTGSFVLGLGCLTVDGFKAIQLKPIDPADVHPDNVLQDGDLLLSRANTLQLVALPGIYEDIGYTCTYPDLMMRLVPKPCLLPKLFELVIRYSPLRNHLVCNANGTSGSMMKINAATVMNAPIIFPGIQEQKRILQSVETCDEMLATTRREQEKALVLKQGIMHDLLTGQVRVPPHLLEATP